MRTLVIYDSTGKIWLTMTGVTEEPTGLLFLWVEDGEVPKGKVISNKVDVTDPSNPKIILEDLPKSSEQLKLEELQTQLTKTSATLDSVLTDLIPSLMG